MVEMVVMRVKMMSELEPSRYRHGWPWSIHHGLVDVKTRKGSTTYTVIETSWRLKFLCSARICLHDAGALSYFTAETSHNFHTITHSGKPMKLGNYWLFLQSCVTSHGLAPKERNYRGAYLADLTQP